MIDESMFLEGRKKMDEVVVLVEKELNGVQTGRAKPDMIDKLKIEAYEGTALELRELATITTQDSHTLVIKPWDASVIKAIEKGINSADLGVNGVVDEQVIRIKIPQLTEERRKELVKMVHQRVESGKAMIRQVRLEMKKEIDDQKDAEGVSEDDIHVLYQKLQDLVDEYNGKLIKLEENKEKELMAI